MNITVMIVFVLIGAIITQVLGAIWYSKLAFGKLWMKAVGKSEMDIKMAKGKVWKDMLVGFIGALLVSFFLFSYAATVPYLEWWEAVYRGLMWVALFAAPMAIASYMYEDRSILAFFIFYAYMAVAVILQLVLFTQFLQ